IINVYAQQSDTSSYFPLGFWGIWIDPGKPPFNPMYLTPDQWIKEKTNWMNTNGNYLTNWIPEWMENQVMEFADISEYRMDITRWRYDHIIPEISVLDWIKKGSGTWSEWTAEANIRIQNMVQAFGSRNGLYSYTLAHECPVVNWWPWSTGCNDSNYTKSLWPRLQYAAQKLKEVDPNRNHKSVAISGLMPNVGFFDNVPSLDVLQNNVYVFKSTTSKNYLDQQYQLNDLLNHYNGTINQLRLKETEWQAIIQSQRDYRIMDTFQLRRPTFEEIRVQAYLAISRGARGIISFVYGSLTPSINGEGAGEYTTISPLLSGGNSFGQSLYQYDGLVDGVRNPFDAINYPGDPAFDYVKNIYLELAQIGPVIKKLKHYNYFPNISIPSNNSANIFSISGEKIEVGTFKRMDEGIDSTNYFILVNRVLNNSDGSLSSPQTINIIISGGKYSLVSQNTKTRIYGTYDASQNRTSFILALEPGKGELYFRDSYPAKPQNLKVTANSEQDAVLTWSANIEPDIISGGSYKIYKASTNGEEPTTFGYITSIPAYPGGVACTTWTDVDPAVGSGSKKLFYKISAVDNNNKESIKSDYDWVAWNGNFKKKGFDNFVKEYKNELIGSYPNPFNPTTKIKLQIGVSKHVTLKVFDLLGREVATLVNEPKQAGEYEVELDANKLGL
ncbi:MAG: hypothetical protein KKH32_12505, partial [Bacteroidetes bacterium]|nr:hypothetical protein [Bacteroidota bacterium]